MNGIGLLALLLMAAITTWAHTPAGRAWINHRPGDDT